MVVTDLVTLVETARKMVARKGELDRAYFEDFVQPVWDAFVKVHEDYKKSFREYAELLAKPDCTKAQLIERVRSDSIYTEDLRGELGLLFFHLGTGRRSKVGILQPLARAMSFYFSDLGRLGIEKMVVPRFGNIERYELVTILSRMEDSDDGRRKAGTYIERAALHLQFSTRMLPLPTML